VGARYSFPTVLRPLKKHGVRAARFNRTVLPWRWTYANLRSHRKLLIIDGQRAFTGGLNIRDGHLVDARPRRPIVDLHFEVEGPVVEQMVVAFAEDWHFVTHERLDGDGWFPVLPPCGGTFARAIIDGPDDDLDKLRWTVLGALACAKREVVIVTPYFLPEADLLAALSLAVLRGVQVTVLIPEHNNQWLVKWACDALLPQVLEWGVRVFRVGGAFDHTKVMLVDAHWVLFGSANLDPRSLRLNFELNLEAYSEELARDVGELVAEKRGRSLEVTLREHEARSIFRRLRDGFARLFVPYL
ncbi:MAG: GspH/FimT family pseudopilin, partial [Myxococcales bacterium]|nr:GspH/FimT family pseudopilin [Myxococcales bacterium]